MNNGFVFLAVLLILVGLVFVAAGVRHRGGALLAALKK